MAKRNLKASDVIIKITFDLHLDGKNYRNVELDYKPEKKWCLTWEDIHYEDNDSWNCVGIKDSKGNELCYDFQIHGEDDEIDWNKNKLWIDGCSMYKAEGEECWSHGDDWLSYHDNVKFSNVKIHTQNGKVETIRVGQW